MDITKLNSTPIETVLENTDVKQRFFKLLGERSEQFLATLLSVVNQNKNLRNCSNQSILYAALRAASLNLPIIHSSLGYAYIVNQGNEAQLWIGARGYVQLALRTGLIKKIVHRKVFEGELVFKNTFEDIIKFDESQKKSDKVIGYYAMFETIDGYRKWLYWTKEEMEIYGKKNSKTFNRGAWNSNFDEMAEKTILSNLFRKWAPISVEERRTLFFPSKGEAKEKPDFLTGLVD